MKKLYKYLKHYKKEAFFGPFFKLFEATLELIVPLVIAAIIDNGINGGKGLSYIVFMCFILLILATVGLIASVTAQYFCAKAAVGFASRLRHELFLKMQSLSYSEMDEMGTSTMVARMTSDVLQVQNGLNMSLRLLLRSPFVVLGAMIMAFIVDAKTAWIFVIVIPLLSLVVFGILLITKPLYLKVQKQLDKVLKSTRENLQGVRVIRAFQKEEKEIKQYQEHLDDLNHMQKKVGKISALMNPLTLILVNLAILTILYVAGERVYSGLLITGSVVALYNYMSQILIELIKFANLIVNISKAIVSAGRIATVLDMESSLQHTTSVSKDLEDQIVFDHVSLQYKTAGAPSLHDISFSVKKGETVGIIGGTGSGKTSLVNLIPHFYDASEGCVYINGKDVKSYDPITLRERIGVVPQKAVLFKGSIRSNMKWADKNATDEAIYEALKIAQAEEVILKKEDGLDSIVEQNGQNFSGGQRQRLTIARALVNKPDILILDDSASALDYLTDLNLRKAIQKMEKTPTTFIVSQRTSSIMHADKIIVLEDGYMVGYGTHTSLLENCEVYQEIFASQFKKEAA